MIADETPLGNVMHEQPFRRTLRSERGVPFAHGSGLVIEAGRLGHRLRLCLREGTVWRTDHRVDCSSRSLHAGRPERGPSCWPLAQQVLCHSRCGEVPEKSATHSGGCAARRTSLSYRADSRRHRTCEWRPDPPEVGPQLGHFASESRALLVLVRHGQSQRNVVNKKNRFYLDDESRQSVKGIPGAARVLAVAPPRRIMNHERRARWEGAAAEPVASRFMPRDGFVRIFATSRLWTPCVRVGR